MPQDEKDSNKGSEDLSIPRDVKLMGILLKSMGVEDCDPNVIDQLLEFAYRYTHDVLQDALVYSEHASKKE
ncbi:Transcription initiation factor TFIID subunit 9 [Zancudomyces culisetae]|uniref:Transcription initiation factor TFIID subunit 9 n=1 Tax=Zancudomyces culisetae TaxID=1213189 RepID=A0A1R1PHQ0_ZANCU|nr:Transcription initiation factor TFIID subunit 9 [Zancudomyces culisetae]|eukprot:OMH80525.1 Transcription initiation factor TFIID subunit 9 [Zancudomyces culisetae]